MMGYSGFARNQFQGPAEMSFDMIPELEPNYLEGRLNAASYNMLQQNLDAAEHHLDHVTRMDPGHPGLKEKKDELQRLKNNENVDITLPVLKYSTYLDASHYEQYLFNTTTTASSTPPGQLAGRRKKFCTSCGTRY